MNWKNYGDVNLFEYPSTLVKQSWDEEVLKESPELASEYDVLEILPNSIDGIIYAGLCCVDVDDYRDDWILKGYFGSDMSDVPDDVIAATVVNCYGTLHLNGRGYHYQYPSTLFDLILTKEDLAQWLILLGAGEHIPNE